MSLFPILWGSSSQMHTQSFHSFSGIALILILHLITSSLSQSTVAIQYIFVPKLLDDFNKSEEFCQNNYYGHLAAIHSWENNSEVVTKCQDIGQFQSACRIGLDNSIPTPTQWSDGTSVDFVNWYTDEPDASGSQPIVVIRQDQSWRTMGQASLPFVCQGYPCMYIMYF